MKKNTNKKRWTRMEIDLLRRGQIPAHRTEKAARLKCILEKIPLTGDLLGIDISPQYFRKIYTPSDLKKIQAGEIPNGWTYELCRYVSRTRLGVSFKRLKVNPKIHIIISRITNGESQSQIAQSMGISRQRVSQIVSKHRQDIQNNTTKGLTKL